MQYRSTRDQAAKQMTAPEAILQGLAPDGGLFVPQSFPQPDYDLGALVNAPYQEVATTIWGWFFDDFSLASRQAIVRGAYGEQWDDSQIAPLSERVAGNYYLELFHGPTLAFKDVALQALPRLMKEAVTVTGDDKQIIILTATSGDTGSAAMRGFSDVTGTQVVVFYPDGGVSPVQLRQMLAMKGDNLAAVAVAGNFDDAQTEVKKIFNDQEFAARLAQAGDRFSSANSMNIGRLIPQLTYYFTAYGQLVKRGEVELGAPVNFAVPTGNFGDILAGYYAKKLGLPINKLLCASNQNRVLTDFFATGHYDRRRPFHLTTAPAMDILVSSNLERLLFDLYDQEAGAVDSLMKELNQTGEYQVTDEVLKRLHQDFVADWASEEEISEEIRRIYLAADYVIDPHTAVGSVVAHRYKERTGDNTPMVVVATASPYKFAETVYPAVTGKETAARGLQAIQGLNEFLGEELSPGVKALFEGDQRSEQRVEPSEMAQLIEKRLGLTSEQKE